MIQSSFIYTHTWGDQVSGRSGMEKGFLPSFLLFLAFIPFKGKNSAHVMQLCGKIAAKSYGRATVKRQIAYFVTFFPFFGTNCFFHQKSECTKKLSHFHRRILHLKWHKKNSAAVKTFFDPLEFFTSLKTFCFSISWRSLRSKKTHSAFISVPQIKELKELH